ncbi:MAG: DUF4389 domain-containing protein [Cellvibrionales bacterium]|nr:DUF4389 domain-containing protein [Porticoccaceae bacterium]|tara:strand:+ start:12409 stop:12843 length:435 start_codon:yes stop_codon:yes gene_type:complete
MSDNVKKSLSNLETWIRIGYIAFFLFLLSIASSVAFLLVLLQAASVLLTGRDNEKLREFGQSLGQWGFQSLLFATYNAEHRPFPFSDWPSAETGAGLDEEIIQEVGGVDAHAVPSDSNNADDIPSFTASEDKPTSADGGGSKAV